MSLEVVERNDHPSGRRCGADGVDRGEGGSIARVRGDVGTVGRSTGEGKLAFEFGVGGQGIGRTSGGGRSGAIARVGWYELDLKVERVIRL